MIGLLVMAYGGPDKLEDVEPYILDVRNHRPTPRELIEEMRERYARIGGRSPILERTTAQASALESAVASLGIDCRAWVGMRHWHPYIGQTVRTMEAAGITRAVGVVMAPHYSRMSIGAYERKVREAGAALEFRMIESWHLMPEYIATVLDLVERAARRFPEEERRSVPVILSAHSLPKRIVSEDDPYAAQFEATVDALRARLDGRPCHLAYQSAAMTGEPWLGPDASEVIEELAKQGCRTVIVAPIGFTSEHVEILYDVDVEYREHAQSLGMRLERIDMMNDHPLMMRGLARLVRAETERANWR